MKNTGVIEKPAMPSDSKKDAAEKAFENLLDTLGDINPAVRDLVRAKYEDDEREFQSAVEEQQPSQEPSYWANKSCRKCHGRGIIGKQHIFMPGRPAQSINKSYTNSVTKMDIKCRCTIKNYYKWLSDFRVKFNADKAKSIITELEGDYEESTTEEK